MWYAAHMHTLALQQMAAASSFCSSPNATQHPADQQLPVTLTGEHMLCQVETKSVVADDMNQVPAEMRSFSGREQPGGR